VGLTGPVAHAIVALDRIADRYDLAQQKATRAMAFVNARSAEAMGDGRRCIECTLTTAT